MSVPAALSTEVLELTLRDLPRPWRWSELFGEERPVEVEIGTGNGAFLVDAALRSPERGFLGVEVSKKFFTKALKRAAREGAANARMVCADASYVVANYIPPESVEAYHIYFPEPWPKARHARRRLFKEPLVASLAETLKAGGRLLVATDVADYFEAIEALVDAEERLERLGELAPPLASVRGRVTTSYEEKYRAEGRSIRYAAWRRRPSTPGERQAPESAESPEEEPMPHVIVERPAALEDYVASFKPLTHQEGETVCKALEAYLNSSGSSALVKAVVVDEGQTQKFFVLISEKHRQATVRLLRMTDPAKTRGVKLLLALVAKDLLERSPGASYGATNMEPFLFPAG